MKRWAVLLDGENVWSCDGVPETFATEAEAEAELIQYFKDCEDAVAMGYMTDVGDDCDFRIAEVDV